MGYFHELDGEVMIVGWPRRLGYAVQYAIRIFLKQKKKVLYAIRIAGPAGAVVRLVRVVRRPVRRPEQPNACVLRRPPCTIQDSGYSVILEPSAAAGRLMATGPTRPCPLDLGSRQTLGKIEPAAHVGQHQSVR